MKNKNYLTQHRVLCCPTRKWDKFQIFMLAQAKFQQLMKLVRLLDPIEVVNLPTGVFNQIKCLPEKDILGEFNLASC